METKYLLYSCSSSFSCHKMRCEHSPRTKADAEERKPPVAYREEDFIDKKLSCLFITIFACRLQVSLSLSPPPPWSVWRNCKFIGWQNWCLLGNELPNGTTHLSQKPHADNQCIHERAFPKQPFRSRAMESGGIKYKENWLALNLKNIYWGEAERVGGR